MFAPHQWRATLLLLALLATCTHSRTRARTHARGLPRGPRATFNTFSWDFGSANSSNANTSNAFDVIVVGCGLSGVVALDRLVRGGLNVVCLEAGEDIGGRLKTVEFGGVNAEIGGAWIHGIGEAHDGSFNPMWEFAKTLNMRGHLYNYEDALTFDAEGTVLSREALRPYRAMYDKMHKFMRFLRLRNAYCDVESEPECEWEYSMRDGLEDLGFFDWAANWSLAEHVVWQDVDYMAGQTPSQTSLGGFYPDFTEDGWKSPHLDWLVTSGFSEIPKSIARPHADRVRLSSRVERVSYGESGVAIAVEGGETFTADQVILTPTIAVLKSGSIQFDPPLPTYRRALLDRFNGTTFYAKLFLKFPHSFWPQYTLFSMLSNDPENPSDRGRFGSLVNLNHPHFFPGSNILVLEQVGDLALAVERDPIELSISRTMVALRTMFGQNIPEPIEAKRSDWSQNPDFLMSYTNWPVGWSDEDYLTMCSSIDDAVFFGGEACSLDFFGYTHGAFYRGYDVADEVLRIRQVRSS